ncbi:mitotic spindle assembly checkpoint protein MAD1 [Anabrus simplex]|uniref:mitotic spindle assembly checkpoint protein MAD1 n=1 Tax=Anabrus simplex TaxID=316456 RepID=UPI0034DD7AB7
MSCSKEDDPTCVTRMLEEFRSSALMSRLKNRRSSGASFVTRLNFDSPSDSKVINKRPGSDESFSDSSKKLKSGGLDDSVTDGLSSPWDTCRLRAELVNANTAIAMLKGQINKLHAVRTELQVAFESEKQTLLVLQDHDREKIKSLEKRVKVLRRREIDIRNELEEYRESADALRFKLEASVQSLRKENEELRGQLKDVELDSRKTFETTDYRLDELETELKHTEEEVEELRERCSHLEEKASEAVRQQMAAEQKAVHSTKLQLRVSELESELERGREMAAAVQAQHEKLMRLPEMEHELSTLREELAHLREAVPQKLLLEEMVQDLKNRVKHMEDVEHQLAEAQAARDHLEASLMEWQQVAREHCEGSIIEPGVLRRQLGDLQRNVLVCTDELAQVRSQLKQSEAARESLIFKVETAKQNEEKQHQQIEQQTQLVRRLQKKLLLITRERDSYRSQLDSYEKELTMTSSLSGSNVQQLRARIDTLEKTVEGYRDMVERLEVELEGALGTTGTASLVERIKRLESERDALAREKEVLAKRRDELERQLEHRALQGDYNPGASKLLHFRLNPAAEAEAQREADLMALKAERDSLLARVAILEEMGGRPEDLTERVQHKVTLTASEEVRELREKVKSGEIKLQRFMEVFKTSIREFREVCYTLFGYKVDRIETNHYQLTSVYSQSPDDHLMFKVLPSGEVNLLETDFSLSVGEIIEKYLHQQNSIPMFLSAVNMDLFAQQ